VLAGQLSQACCWLFTLVAESIGFATSASDALRIFAMVGALFSPSRAPLKSCERSVRGLSVSPSRLRWALSSRGDCVFLSPIYAREGL